MRPHLSQRGVLPALLCVLSAAGCRSEANGEPGDPSPGAAEASTSWTVPSTSGTRVTLSVAPDPLEPGLARFDIRLDHAPPDVLSVTLDLVSPEMPMHGVVRYEAEAVDPGRYQASVNIPMEGYWELYVNLDYGADAAVFELDVALPDGAAPHQHQPGGPGHPAGHAPQT